MKVKITQHEGKTLYTFHCPGCHMFHTVNSSWQFNGDVNNPTLAPSVLVRSGHYCDGHKPGDTCWCTVSAAAAGGFKCGRCHSFVTNGEIHFLSDSTHLLAGQTVPLPELPNALL